MSLGSSSSQQPTQTTQYQLSPEQRQLYNLAMPGVREFASTPLQQYSGSQIAGFTDAQLQGQQQALAAAGNQAQTAQQGTNTLASILNPGFLQPGTNSALSGAIDAAVRPVYQQLNESVLPSVRSDAVSHGSFGGSRQGIAEGLAISRAGQTAADTAAKIAQNEYETNVKAQLSGLGLLPSIQSAQVTPATTTSAVGDVQQNLQQQQLNQQIQDYYLRQYLPLIQSQEVLGLANGLQGGKTVTTGSVPQASTGQQALGGAVSGASLGALLGGPVGAGVGGVGGALLPFLLR